ncbi:MAG TPA: PAS domain-containing sensor histidine kinase, partial [Jatrophihabitantaceae bacterium]|nr:PAS domain-containing sensor histidine kinase [Jatrophihabitantaceae bacterium]
DIAALGGQLAALLPSGTVPGDTERQPMPSTPESAVLGEHLERFREVVEEAAIGIATMTLTGRIVRANKALAELVHRPLGNLVGIDYRALVSSDAVTSVADALHRAQVGKGEIVQVEHGLAGADPDRRVSTTAAPVRDARGRPLYLFAQVQDVTPQRRAEEELRQSEQRFRMLVQAVRDYAIFMLDPDGRVASWNAGAQRIKGYRAKDIIGQHFRVFYPPDMQAIKHPEHELELALSRGSYEEEGWRIRKDGSRFWASVVITAVFGPNGEHIGFAKVTRDIEERRRMLLDAERAASELSVANADLAAANERLGRDAADQAQFLAVTAHELRSPVSVLSGSAQLLVEHWDELEDTERVELSASMTSSAARLQRLVSDLLTASRLEARAIALRMTEVDLADVLNQAVGAARAATPDLAIELDAPSGLTVSGEADRLAQAVENLLDNARRHGQPPIEVRARALGDQIEVVVTDSGPGVAPDMRERLFSRFATGSSGVGTGLGLYIVRELVRAHGGDAWYEPAADGGASFVLTLPALRVTDH